MDPQAQSAFHGRPATTEKVAAVLGSRRRRENGSARGVSLWAVILVIAVLAIIAAKTFPELLRMRSTAVAVSLDGVAKQLNQSSAAFVGTGGTIGATESAVDVIKTLQTPVDAASRKAGFGIFPVVDHRLALSPIEPGSTEARLVMVYDPVLKRPVWSVDHSSDGYDVKMDPTAPLPTTADWTSVVDAKARVSQVNARTSPWVWEYSTTSSARPVDNDTPTTPIDTGLTDAELNITGPTTITSPGSYYWSGTSSLPGGLTITANAVQTSAGNATAVQSNTLTYAAGDSDITTQFEVVLTRAEGGSVSKTVNVTIPAKPRVTLTGPDTVTTTDPQTWGATSSVAADPLSLRVPDLTEQTGTTQVSATHGGWPADTHTTITVVASALNASGFDLQKKIVTINIPAAMSLTWAALDLSGNVITQRGVYHFEARANNTNNQSVSIDGSASSQATSYADQHSPGASANWQAVGGGPIANQNVSTASSVLPVVIDTTALNSAQWLTGQLVLSATGSLDGKECAQAGMTIYLSIPPTSYTGSWTVTVLGANAGTVASLGVQAQNTTTGQSISSASDSSGASSASFSVALPAGTYSVVGKATFNDGSAPKYSAPLSVTAQ